MTDETDRAAALARLREEMARPPFHRVLAPQAVHADPATGVVIIRLPYQPRLSRAPNEASYHGGVIATLIDLAGRQSRSVSAEWRRPSTCASTTCVRRTIPI
jgi:acyl-coenzyme A thioesterase PaaI-like protein